MNGTSKELVGVLKDSTSISSIYQGITLVWGKKEQVANFSGKFSSKASSADYFYYSNQFQGTMKDIVVDEDTKEFSCSISDFPFFTQNHYLEEITAYPDTTNCTSFDSMFSHCEALSYINLDSFNTENVTSINSMFANCYKLTSLDLSNWNTQNLTIISGAFQYCSTLAYLNLSGWDVTKVKSFGYLFSNCYELETLNLDGWDLSNASSFSSMFTSCRKLTNIIGTIKEIKQPIDISAAPLTNDSAMVLINGLSSNSTAYSKKITFSSTTYNTLTDEQKEIATSKGWTIASK